LSEVGSTRARVHKRLQPERLMIHNLCILIGFGSIGKLVTLRTWQKFCGRYGLCFVGLSMRKVSTKRLARSPGTHAFFTPILKARNDPSKCRTSILDCRHKSTQRRMLCGLSHLFQGRRDLSAQNGCWAVREKLLRSFAKKTFGSVMRGTTFMTGRFTSDTQTHVQYESWIGDMMGPFEPNEDSFLQWCRKPPPFCSAGRRPWR